MYFSFWFWFFFTCYGSFFFIKMHTTSTHSGRWVFSFTSRSPSSSSSLRVMIKKCSISLKNLFCLPPAQNLPLFIQVKKKTSPPHPAFARPLLVYPYHHQKRQKRLELPPQLKISLSPPSHFISQSTNIPTGAIIPPSLLPSPFSTTLIAAWTFFRGAVVKMVAG